MGFLQSILTSHFMARLAMSTPGLLTAGSSFRTVIFQFKRSFRTVHLYGVDVERSAENPLSYFPIPNSS